MKELDKIDAEEKVRALSLLGQLKGSVEDVATLVKQVHKKRKAGELNMSKGISFLEVKNQQMLSYIINLTHLMLQKSQGVSINSSPDVERMVEIRTVLEKMRPTEQKLKYQIDKLVRTGSGVTPSETDPLRLRPNPGKLISKLDEDAGSVSNDEPDEEEQDERPQIYKPAKLVPMFYDGDQTVKQKKERLIEKNKKKMANSAVMRDLYQQYTDGPEEIREVVGVNRAKENTRERERREYEENYFVRKSLTKKELHADRKMRPVSGLNDITSFPDFSMFGGSDETNLPGSKKSSGSRKRPSSSKKSKGGKKKRKFRK